MGIVPTISDDLDRKAEERAWAEGEADANANAGRVVPRKAVAAWLKSWGTKQELPPPQCPGE